MAFAYRIAKNLKIREKIIIKGLNKFKGLPHRQEIVFSRKSYYVLMIPKQQVLMLVYNLYQIITKFIG